MFFDYAVQYLIQLFEIAKRDCSL